MWTVLTVETAGVFSGVVDSVQWMEVDNKQQCCHMLLLTSRFELRTLLAAAELTS